jgi:hypothetical protein
MTIDELDSWNEEPKMVENRCIHSAPNKINVVSRRERERSSILTVVFHYEQFFFFQQQESFGKEAQSIRMEGRKGLVGAL